MWHSIFWMLIKRNFQYRSLHLGEKNPSSMKEKIKTIWDEDKRKLKELSTHRPTKALTKQNSLNGKKTLKEPWNIKKEESLW